MKTITVVINKREMTFLSENGKFNLPILYNTDKNQRKNYWKCWVEDNKIYRNSWIENGKIKEYPSVEIFGKNIGKKNETTDHSQALFNAYSYWLKKQDQNYLPEGVDKPENETILPMLAQKYSERKKYLNLPFGVSPKLDGVRVIAFKKDDSIILTSRLGKKFFFMNSLREHIYNTIPSDIILDGELYSHELPFNCISGAVRAKTKASTYDSELEMWIFDIVDNTLSYEERMILLKEIEKKYNKIYKKDDKKLKFVYYDKVNNHDKVRELHDQYVSKGYEGIMCRNLDGKYTRKHRSNDLLKYKDFEDEEFEIIGAKAGVGTEQGAIVFKCKHNKSSFDVRPRGSVNNRREMFKQKDNFIGKILTVRYQNTGMSGKDDIPRFPIGIEVRDYE